MGKGSSKRPPAPAPVQPIKMPTAPAPPPEPEKTAMAPVVADPAGERKTRDTKRRGTAQLVIDMNVPDRTRGSLGLAQS